MLKKLKVSHKITLMICAVALPLVGWTIFATLTGVSKDIQFARQEQKGNQYQRPLQGLLDTLPQHQWLVDAAARGDTAARATLGEKEIEIEQHLSDLDNAQTKYGKDLQFTDAGLAKRKRTGADPAGLRSQWQKLKGATLAPADNVAAHQALIATVRTMISHAGDTSNLILDPDLDSYYLMDATLLTLPQMQDRLARLVSELRVNESARADSVTQNSLTRTIQLTTLLAADLDHLQHAVETSLNEDADNNGTSASLQDNLPAPAAACQNAGREFLRLVSELRVNEPASAASLIDSKLTDSLTNFRATTSALWQVASSELDTLLAKRAAAKSQTRLITLGGVSVTLVIFVVAALFVSRSITHPLAGLTQATQRILRGENTVRAPVYSRDEIGALASTFNNMLDARNRAQAALETENKRLQTNIQDLLVVVSDASDGKLSVRAKVSEGALGNVCDALNLMLENVGGIIANAKSASDQVAAASNGITTVAAELEKGEQRQTAEILTTSEGVRDLNGKAQKVLANCQAATQAAANGRQAAEQGAKAVREVIQGMEKIRENTQANAKKIKRLGDRSMEISGIVKIIGDISAKTDMLALNASIEAARAGEQGRGFTIVAEQVRGLADRTKTLTNQIEKLVNDIQKETAEAVAQMETQTQEVEAGARAAQSAGGTLENIVTVSSESSELVSQINQSATQQAVRTQEMLTTVETINQVVAESAAKVRETRSTSEQLLALSAELNKRLAQFEITPGSDSVVYEPGVMVE